MRFICSDEDRNRILVQGSIVGTALASSTNLISYLEDWKNDGAILTILGLQVYVNASCEVALDDFGSHTQCIYEGPQGQVDPTGGDEVDIGPYVGGIVGAAVVAIVIIIIVVIIVIAVVLVRRSGKQA